MTIATLKKDIVIKAGTKFDTAPSSQTRDASLFSEAIIGLSDNTYGQLVYETGEPGSETRKELSKWFSFEEVPDKKARKRKA